MSSGPVRIWSLLNIMFVQSWSLYCEVANKLPEDFNFQMFTKTFVEEELDWLKKKFY